MNIYAIIILSVILLEFGIELFANILNLKTLGDEIPEEFNDVYDAKDYRISQEYTRSKILLLLWRLNM